MCHQTAVLEFLHHRPGAPRAACRGWNKRALVYRPLVLSTSAVAQQPRWRFTCSQGRDHARLLHGTIDIIAKRVHEPTKCQRQRSASGNVQSCGESASTASSSTACSKPGSRRNDGVTAPMTRRPHSGPGDLTPADFRDRVRVPSLQRGQPSAHRRRQEQRKNRKQRGHKRPDLCLQAYSVKGHAKGVSYVGEALPLDRFRRDRNPVRIIALLGVAGPMDGACGRPRVRRREPRSDQRMASRRLAPGRARTRIGRDQGRTSCRPGAIRV